jgi:peptidoglycan/xylan/chitin deacetylase (PgdA/CDA1 family)
MQANRTPRQRLAEAAIERSGLLGALEWLDRRFPARLLPILMFHRVADPRTCGDQAEPDLISAAPAVFAAEMRYLRENFNPISAADLVAALTGQAPLPRRAVLVTFDDGTRDFKEHCLPVLQRLGIPSVVCVPTALMADPDAIFWQDRLHQVLFKTRRSSVTVPPIGTFSLTSAPERQHAAAHIRSHLHQFPGAYPDTFLDELEGVLDVRAEPFGNVMTWADLRGLGPTVSIIPHGRTHVRLAGLAAPDLEPEIGGSLADVRRELGTCVPLFSYPYGSFDAAAVACVQAAGYTAGLSTRGGFASLEPAERLTLRRVNIYHGTLAHFRLDLTRAFAAYLARRADWQRG